MSSTAVANPKPMQEPPQKKRKKNKCWLVKVPTWVADEWFNDRKYPSASRLGDLYVIPDAKDSKKSTMKLEVVPPPLSPSSNSNHSNGHSNGFTDPSTDPKSKFEASLKQFEVPIPTLFKMQERPVRTRTNVKHGELIESKEKDKLLLFEDGPAFPIGSRVEALDNSLHSRNGMSVDSEDEDVDMSSPSGKKGKKKKTSSSIKGYAKGVVTEVNDDRTFTVRFSKTKKTRYNVPERDIRFQDPRDALNANKVDRKKMCMVSTEMDVKPEWTPQYKQYQQIRSMKKSFQHTMQIKAKVDKFKLSRSDREAEAQRKIEENRRADLANVKASKSTSTKKKRVKNVRKDDEQYKNMIFAAFEKESCLSQKDFERKLGEPWNFLRPVVQQLCDRHKNAEKGGRSWVLKAEYRLATDNAIETSEAPAQ